MTLLALYVNVMKILVVDKDVCAAVRPFVRLFFAVSPFLDAYEGWKECAKSSERNQGCV